MTAGVARLAAAAIGVTIAALAIVTSPPPVGATSPSACTARSGVTVIVDFTHFHLDIERGCASGHPASALAALQSAGFATAGTAQYGDAFVCRINDLPSSAKESCAQTPPAGASWSFYSARPTDTDWTYSTAGVTSHQPPAGSLVGFAFGNDAMPGISPSAVLRAPATPSPTAAPRRPVAALATPTGRPTPTSAPTPAGATSRPAASSTTAAARTPTSTPPRVTPGTSSKTATPHLVERTADVAHDDAGSARPALFALALVTVLSAGGWLTIRARRRRAA